MQLVWHIRSLIEALLSIKLASCHFIAEGHR